jgi:hypothetical protein
MPGVNRVIKLVFHHHLQRAAPQGPGLDEIQKTNFYDRFESVWSDPVVFNQ